MSARPTTLIAGASPDLVEFARELGRRGEQVALLARNEPRLVEFRSRLNSLGTPCESYMADVTDSASVTEAFKRLARWSPRLDRLIYNVGVVSGESASTLTESELVRVMGTNFFGFVNCFQLANEMFKRSGGGQAIVISSADALHPETTGVAYAASKAALQIYAAALRRELQPKIEITEVYLGRIAVAGEFRWLNSDEVVLGLTRAIDERPARMVVGGV
ncbi:SDR family NAD(P)-dependent oxidoreductase [candidate division KSB1 bacterium]|nr:SDR family NAD(P)-dependent oxidoreductase [candidate division KSB1 bacterium]